MKYQFHCIVDVIKNKIFKWILLYLILFLIYYIILLFSFKNYKFDLNFVKALLSINFNSANFILNLLSIFRILIIIYSSYYICIYDYNHSPEFIQFRINYQKRNFYKIVSCLLFLLILRIFYCFIIFIFYNYFNLILCFNTIFIYFSISIIIFIFVCFFKR